MSQSMGDKDPMPFGQHKDKPLEKVPASYLIWLRDQNWIDRWPKLKAYIDRNREVLEKEVDDPKSYGNGG